MPIRTETVNPTVNTAPAPGISSIAHSSMSNTGHGSSIATSLGEEIRSGRWSSFTALVKNPTIALDLKMTYSYSFTGSSGSVSTLLEYSLNNGSSWISIASHSRVGTDNAAAGSSPSISLTLGQAVSQVMVRETISGVGGEGTNKTVTAVLSNIRLESQTNSPRGILVST